MLGMQGCLCVHLYKIAVAMTHFTESPGQPGARVCISALACAARRGGCTFYPASYCTCVALSMTFTTVTKQGVTRIDITVSASR